MFTLYLKTADISICFATSKLNLANYSGSLASELKGQIFMIWANLNLNLVWFMKSSATELGLIEEFYGRPSHYVNFFS